MYITQLLFNYKNTIMNTYKKYCPNVFVAKCESKHEKGDIIILTTKYGKENEHEVYNYLGATKDGFYLYSITRTDGFNAQERAKRKAEKIRGYKVNAEKRSEEAYKRADLSESATGIPFGQPILVGHHSERAHRRVIERADNAMRKSIEEQEKAEQYRRRAEYWESKANEINLSMPESLEYFEFKLYEAELHHKDLKEHPEKRAHDYSLTYAKKEVNNMKKNLDLAVKLWGNDEEIQQINKEKEEQAQAKASKKKNFDNLIKKYGGFFHFGSDVKAFKEKYNKLLESGHIETGEKVTHVTAGLYMPVKNVKAYLNEI